MNLETLYIKDSRNPSQDIKNGIWIIILHVHRIPPHIGLIFNGKYHSLNIKGVEKNIMIETLIKSINVKKTATVAFQLFRHPVFSFDYLSECFQDLLDKSPRIEANKYSCYSPVKSFLHEFYALDTEKAEFVYQLIPFLQKQKQVAFKVAFNIENGKTILPEYTRKELEEGIQNAYREVLSIQAELG